MKKIAKKNYQMLQSVSSTKNSKYAACSRHELQQITEKEYVYNQNIFIVFRKEKLKKRKKKKLFTKIVMQRQMLT